MIGVFRSMQVMCMQRCQMFQGRVKQRLSSLYWRWIMGCLRKEIWDFHVGFWNYGIFHSTLCIFAASILICCRKLAKIVSDYVWQTWKVWTLNWWGNRKFSLLYGSSWERHCEIYNNYHWKVQDWFAINKASFICSFFSLISVSHLASKFMEEIMWLSGLLYAA
jgi:hypothetical protein